ncbi:AsmA family protein [Rhodobacteraceae bacterium M382]|nr:AsmA family protein [Rhodobacteraceae bacterium M382]
MRSVDQETDTGQTGDAPPSRRRPHRRALRWGAWVVAILSIALSGAIFFGMDRNLTAPDWLRARVSQRIEQNLNGMTLDFGRVDFVVNKGWRPRIRLQDVVLARDDGRVLAQLAHAEASLAMRPLLRGQIQPKQIELSGAYGQLQRDASGQFALSLGDGSTSTKQAASLPQLIEQGDQLFLHPQLQALTSVQMDALTLSYEDLGQGRAWTLDGGQIRLVRRDDDLRISALFSLLSGRDYASGIDASYASRIGDTEADISVSIHEVASQDIAAQNVALEWLGVLDAPISGALRGNIDSDGAVGPISATLQIGQGVLKPADQARPVSFRGARSYFTYDPVQQRLTFDELSLDSDWGIGAAAGGAYLYTDDQGHLTDLVGQFSFRDVQANPGNFYEAPLTLSKATADFRLQLNPFRFTLGEALVHLDQSKLRLSADASVQAQDLVFALNAELDQLDVPAVKRLWPASLAPKPRKWVADNLLSGDMSQGRFSIRGTAGQKPVIQAGFTFDNASIRFLKTMPPIQGGGGQASLVNGRFVVLATKGTVTGDAGGPIDVAGTSFIIPDIRIKKAAPSVTRVTGRGEVTSVMSLLARPPLSVLKNTVLPVNMVDGMAYITGTLALPLRDKVPFEDIKFHLKGDIRDVSSTLLVPGHTLTADALDITGDQSAIRIHGQGALSGIPVRAEWSRPIGKGVSPDSQVSGTVELSAQVIDTFNIGLPPGTVSGRGQGQFVLDLGPNRAARLSVTSDLQGVGLQMAELGWRKPTGTSGTLDLSGELGDKVQLDKLILQAAGLTATGSVINRTGGGLDRALLSSIRVGGWLDAAVELVGRGTSAPEIRILSGTLDLRKAPFGSSGTSSAAGAGTGTGPMDVALNQLQITDSISLTGFRGDFSTQGGFNGKFSGRLNGGTAVTGLLVPRENGSAIRIQSQDAGGVFRDSGILSNGQGGSFDMTLLPTAEEGHFEGQMSVRNTRVKNGPAIGALVNSISVIGLLDELTGNGIQFNAVDARFRLGPSVITVYESSAEGPSIGLSMDGTFDVERSLLNMRGVISPVYLLNAIGSLVTRKGEGVFGFSYRLTGPTTDPSVQVNPLSGLAPAMLRDIFRTPGAKAPQTELPVDQGSGGAETGSERGNAGDR